MEQTTTPQTQTASYCYVWIAQDGSAQDQQRPTVTLELANLEDSVA